MAKKTRSKSLNPLVVDPSRTLTLRSAYQADLKRRFKTLIRKIKIALIDRDVLGIKKTKNPLINVEIDESDIPNPGIWRFRSDSEKVEEFRNWISSQMSKVVFQNMDASDVDSIWRFYALEGLKRGMGRTFKEVRPLRRPKFTSLILPSDVQQEQEFFLQSAFNRPITVDKLKILAGRQFNDLKGITDDMSTKISRTLVDGLSQRQGPRDIARTIDSQIESITRQRALTLARTEVVRAHAEGQLLAMEQLGVTEFGVAVEWSVTKLPDGSIESRVCELCAPLDGVVMKIEEAKGMLPRHPNCRCAYIPANVGESVDKQKRDRESILDAIRKSVERETSSSWIGSERKITKDRPESVLGNQFEDVFGMSKEDYLVYS